MEVCNEEHSTVARNKRGINYKDSYSLHSSEHGENIISKQKDTGSTNADIPLLSEVEKRELVSLVKDKNISMDFILEMKEAFLLFDKVRQILF